MSNLWELADEFEARSRDRHTYGPLARHVWATAWQELVARLEPRGISNAH